MGKIYDAIRKVQRNRIASDASTSATKKPPIHNEQDDARFSDVAAAPDQSAEKRVWNYGGSKISIDRLELINAGFLDPDYSRKHLTQEYRKVRRAILTKSDRPSLSSAQHQNLIMVGSAEAREGRSFICLNLAMSLAGDPDHTVVLVDCDTNNSRLSDVLGIADEIGLTDLLLDSSIDPIQIISPTDISGLSVLAAGKGCRNGADILSSPQTTKLLDNLAATDPKRIFLFDSPPVISSAESIALAQQVGQIIFVVHAGKTPQKSVWQALDELKSDRPINIVLNQAIY